MTSHTAGTAGPMYRAQPEPHPWTPASSDYGQLDDDDPQAALDFGGAA